MTDRLRLREDGTFTIVQFTDLHWQNGEKDDLATRQLIVRALQAEKPDLVVVTGDIIFGGKCRDPAESLRQAVLPIEQAGVPWTAVFGNHDDEGSLDRAALMDVLRSRPRCMAEPGPAGIGGIGNHALTVADAAGRTAFALYCLDSGAYSQVPSIGGYDWIRSGQIEWYSTQARDMASANGGRPVPSLLFFHIPIPEYVQVWRAETCYGHRYERPACPKINSGLFASMLEAGGTLGAFCGHDHLNDYWGELAGIRLCYGRLTGYQAYGRKMFRRGARVIRLTKGAPSFETWIRLADGSVDRQTRKHRSIRLR